jgi:hypothetical protein
MLARRLMAIIFPGTSSLTLNIAFALSYTACAYNFYRAITLDPGYSKLPKDEEELHSVRIDGFACVLNR